MIKLLFQLLVWFIFITFIPGLSILLTLYGNVKQYEFIERFILATGIGISNLIIVSYLLDRFFIINLAALIIALLPFPCIVILLHYKVIFRLFEKIIKQPIKDTLKEVLNIKSKFIKFSTSTLLLVLVLCFVIFCELIDLLDNNVLGANDQWLWLLFGKIIAITGHFRSTHGYFESHPYGAAYFLGMMFLPNLVNPYYIVLFIGPFLSFLQLLGVYVASKKVLNTDKLAIYAVLVYGTSRLIIWRGKMFTPEAIGLFLIIILALFLFEQNVRADIFGLLTLLGIGLTSFGSLGSILLPTLLYVVFSKSKKVSIIAISGIIIGGLVPPYSLLRRIWAIISVNATFNLNVWPVTIFFYKNAQWTFGYSLAFSFIGLAYYLINRSSKRTFYVICFLELLILSNFLYLRLPVRIYPFFSIFASTLTAQGLSVIIKFIKDILPAPSKRWNIKVTVPQFIIVLCIIYQVFFGMVRGYHAYLSRHYQLDEIVAIIWLDTNSPKDATVLAAPIKGNNPYRDILYPRNIIFASEIYNYNSIIDLVKFCSENNIDYIIMMASNFSYEINSHENFKEVYKNNLMIIFELLK